MYEGIYGIYAIVALLLVAAWGIAGYLIARLAFRRTRGGLRLTAWITLVIVGLAGLLVTANALTVWWLWSSIGWWFAQDLVILALPLTVLPAAATLVVSLPRLWRLARGAVTDPRAKVDASTRGSASALGLVVPAQTAAVGAVLGAYAAFFRHVPPLLDTAVALWALLIAATATLWVRQLRRCRAMSKPEAPMASKLGIRAVRAAAVVLAFGVGFGVRFTWSAQASVLPERFSMLAHENVDYGGGPEVGHGTGTGHSHGSHDGSGDGQAVSVTELTGPGTEKPDRRFALTAQEAQVKLASGKTVDAWTFNGQAPGPELRVRQGDLVEVTLVNEDVEDGLTIHWRGLDVPNAEDGVRPEETTPTASTPSRWGRTGITPTRCPRSR